MKKPRIAVFDLTDCEGCEVEIVSMKERLGDLASRFDIVEWRLVQVTKNAGGIDIALVEGCPSSEDEIRLLREIRERSKILVALGSCACLGGIPGMIDRKERKSLLKKIYSARYVPKALDCPPLSDFVRVDCMIPGCPASPKGIEELFGGALIGNFPKPKTYPVCLECKRKGNDCLLLGNEPCLGPITRGGCGAICTGLGKTCYGCFGLADDARLDAMMRLLTRKVGRERSERQVGMFLMRNPLVRKMIGKEGGKNG